MIQQLGNEALMRHCHIVVLDCRDVQLIGTGQNIWFEACIFYWMSTPTIALPHHVHLEMIQQGFVSSVLTDRRA